jgi:hypothetical protein
MRVLKFQIPGHAFGGVAQIVVPADHKFTFAGIQDGKPFIWAICGDENIKVSVNIHIATTGLEIPVIKGYTPIFISQITSPDLSIVFHAFEYQP